MVEGDCRVVVLSVVDDLLGEQFLCSQSVSFRSHCFAQCFCRRDSSCQVLLGCFCCLRKVVVVSR